ncbi:Ribonuclease ribotoxin [Pyrrhoderma noxium]|uniref:Ribonuclease ribotoxin n=1 Tax=Pyrrhoderma noxium TaxID=2282107 RepID=A0A286UEP4_9AGAM|nr:Ribonuclease ribotoxin [Pyrrhoderma noxium]
MAYGIRKMAIEIVLEMAGGIYKYNMFSDVIKNRFVISSIHASPLKRSLPSGVVTCGSNRYTVSAITAAIDAGVNDMDEGVYPDNYPHQYYDYADEHITLYCSGDGPWYEFPIMPDGSIYYSTSNNYVSPGTDRVVFTESGTYCAVVTHTGASSTNGFVACDND